MDKAPEPVPNQSEPPREMIFARLIDAFRPADGPPPARLSAFMRWCLAGAGGVMLLALAASVAVGLSEVATAWFIGWAIDFAVAHGPVDLFANNWPAFLALAGFFVLIRPALMGINAGFSSMAIGANLYPLVLSRLHRHTLGQALSFFDEDFAGRIAQKQQQTARALTDIVMETMNVGGFALASALGATTLVAGIHPALGMVLVAWLVAYLALIRWFLPRIRVRSKARAGARAMVTGQLVDTITNVATVKLFAHGAHEDRAALDALGRFRGTAVQFGELSVWFRFSLMTLAGTLPVLLVGGALFLWTRDAATTGEIAVAALVSTRIAQMSGWVSFTALGIFSNVGEVEDGMRTLAHEHRIRDRETAEAPDRVAGAVAFDDVSFGYGRTGAALKGLSLKLAPGEKVGLVGRSGAGKTTTVALLLRLYELEEGSVTLDGVDVRDYEQDALRRQIAMVTQDTAMFNRSARDNIAYGRPDAEEAEIVAAAKQAAAHDFIVGLRDDRGREGYDARLGERGVKLSVGQRQRIALARAILKDAPVLVLDEATSALDSEVEAIIQETLKGLMEGRTVIAIAHRLSTIAALDRIVVLDDGQIVEDGTHEALLAKGGLYASFWARQSGGFLGVEAAE